MVAYAAQAELSCFLALDWPLPVNVIDLFVEHRVATNGRVLPCGNGLLGTLAYRGLGSTLTPAEKEAMRRLVTRSRLGGASSRQREIVGYCGADVDGVDRFAAGGMRRGIDWFRALVAGPSTGSVAARRSAPASPSTRRRTSGCSRTGGRAREGLVREVDRDFGVYDGITFKADRFAAWTAANNIAWPRLASGRLALNDDTFKQQALRFPQVQPLRELRATLGKLRLTGLAVGADGRNRFDLAVLGKDKS